MPEPFPPNLFADLNRALNEAELHHARVRTDIAQAIIDLRVLALPEVGPEPDERERVFRLHLTYVGRVACSLRTGAWNDQEAAVDPFPLDQLDQVVGSFGVQPIYGGMFFDPPEEAWENWRNRLSLDVEIEGGSTAHVLQLFQESSRGPARHLDFRIWFNGMSGYDYDNQPKAILDVAAAGNRWWDALHGGDARAQGHGIVSGGPWESSDRN